MKIVVILLLSAAITACGSAVVRDLRQAGCSVKTYHERSQTGEVLVECFRVEELN